MNIYIIWTGLSHKKTDVAGAAQTLSLVTVFFLVN
jgi:hypothetical protein